MSLTPSPHHLTFVPLLSNGGSNLSSLHSPEVLCLYVHIYVNACSIIPTSYVYNVCGCLRVSEETVVKATEV